MEDQHKNFLKLFLLISCGEDVLNVTSIHQKTYCAERLRLRWVMLNLKFPKSVSFMSWYSTSHPAVYGFFLVFWKYLNLYFLEYYLYFWICYCYLFFGFLEYLNLYFLGYYYFSEMFNIFVFNCFFWKFQFIILYNFSQLLYKKVLR